MIRAVKRTALTTLRSAGAFKIASHSQWRRERLLILGYHGIAQQDEHHWDPALFISAQLLESRLYTLREHGFNILPLGDALARLAAGRLPERSVVLTFDDGYVDFYRLAAPILKTYNAPATIYLTTYYSEKNLPVPGITAAYMLWMSAHFRGRLKTIPGFAAADFSDPVQRREVSRAIGAFFTNSRAIPTDAKHALLQRLATEVGFDLDRLRERRLMHLMTLDEAREVAAMGFDIQMHTHRHQVPPNEPAIRREIDDNRQRIEAITGRPAHHLCYPSGVHYPELLPWLRALDVRSATTCAPNLATAADDPLLLPRFVDHSGVSQVEFEAWVSGVASMLPRRHACEPASDATPARATAG